MHNPCLRPAHVHRSKVSIPNAPDIWNLSLKSGQTGISALPECPKTARAINQKAYWNHMKVNPTSMRKPHGTLSCGNIFSRDALTFSSAEKGLVIPPCMHLGRNLVMWGHREVKRRRM